MTDLPTSGGSYIRHPDGSLELVEGSITAPVPVEAPDSPPAPAAASEAQPQAALEGALKAPLKE